MNRGWTVCAVWGLVKGWHWCGKTLEAMFT